MIKTLTLILLVLTLSSTVKPNCQNDVITRIRNQKEYFIQSIVLKTPTSPGQFKFCKQAWTTNGTCCDPELLAKGLPQLLDNFTLET
jgi:hypothetical protein